MSKDITFPRDLPMTGDEGEKTNSTPNGVGKKRNYAGKISQNVNYHPLFSSDGEDLNNPIRDPNIMSLDTIGDGSCFFHALTMSFFAPYMNNTINRQKFVRELRKNLADELSNKISPISNLTYYEKISEGQLPELSKIMPEVSLEHMKGELNSSRYVSNIYNEFISDALNRDIYLINYETKDIYMTGTKISNLYKNRPSTIILYKPGHYEVIGYLENNSTLRLSFNPDHPYIIKLKMRIQELSKD